MLLNPYRFGASLPPGGVPTTWDPTNKSSRITLSDGNRRENHAAAGYSGVRSIASNSSGKWYVEITRSFPGRMPGLVNAQADMGTFPGGDAYGLGIWWSTIYRNDQSVGTFYEASSASVIGMRIDLDARTLQYVANGVLSAAISLMPGDVYIASGCGTSAGEPGSSSYLNAGQDPFSYPVPDGFTPGFW